jgi:hypothetical protein
VDDREGRIEYDHSQQGDGDEYIALSGVQVFRSEGKCRAKGQEDGEKVPVLFQVFLQQALFFSFSKQVRATDLLWPESLFAGETLGCGVQPLQEFISPM